MKMLETLTASQAELSKNQSELVQQPSRANSRVQQLDMALSKAKSQMYLALLHRLSHTWTEVTALTEHLEPLRTL